MSDDSAGIRSYKNRDTKYVRPDIPPDDILIDFHTKWFKGNFEEAASVLAHHYGIDTPHVAVGPLPPNAFSSYDIENLVITISDSLVLTNMQITTFLESFFKHLSSQRNWDYNREISQYLPYERSEAGRFTT